MSNPVQDFINGILAAKQYQHAQHSGAVSQLAGDLMETPRLIAKQVTGQRVTPEDQARAQRGSEQLFGMLSGGTEAQAAEPSISAAADLAGNATKIAYQSGKKAVGDVADAAGAQPGGLQAGFIKPAEEIGTKTKAEIQAAKEAGLPPIVNSARGLPPIESGILDAKGNPVSSQPRYAYENKSTTPMSPQAEEIPQRTPQSAQAPTKPYPNVPDEPVVVTDRVGKHPVTGGNPVLVDIRNQKHNKFYQQDQDSARAIMDKYVAGNNALEVERNLPLQLQEESQRIKNIIAQKPQNISMDDIVSANESNMAKAGITRGNSGKADTATEELLKELHSQISAGSNDVVPNKVDGQTLMDYKHLLDDRLKSVYKKNDLNTTLTPAENATLTLRRTIDQKLTELYPKTKEALNRQSAMMDARESVAKAARDEESAQLKQATTPLPPKPGLLDQIRKHPAMSVLGALGVGGLVQHEVSKVPFGDVGGAVVNSLTHNDSKGATGNLTLDTSPPAHLPSDQVKKTTGLQYTADDYQRDIKDPRYASNANNFQVQTEANWKNAQAIASQNLPAGIKGFMGGTAQQALKSQDELKSVNIEGLSQVAQRLKTLQDYQGYVSNPNNPYAKELASLNNANSTYGQAVMQATGQQPDEKNLIKPGDTGEQMKEKLLVQNQFIKNTQKQYQAYWDAINPTNEVTTPQQTYQQNTGGLPSPVNGALPPIPQGFSI